MKQATEFKQLCPNIKTGVLFPWWNMPRSIVSIAKQCYADFVGFDAKIVTKELIEQSHSAGFPVYV